MEFNFDNILSQLLISVLGMAIFIYGKKMQRLWPLVAGAVMSIYPCFVVNFWVLWGITVGLMGGLYMLRDQ